jgi:membrane protease YdiL (CAAX protease family)
MKVHLERPKFIKKYEIIIFYCITLGITWTGWFMLDTFIMPLVENGANFDKLIFEQGQYHLILISLFGSISVFGPGIAAFISIAIVDGKTGVRELIKKILGWRVPLFWYAAALVLPILIKYGGYVFNALFLSGTLSVDFAAISSLMFIPIFIEQLIPSGGQEEVGWTGFAQLRLQERYSVFKSTLIKVIMGWVWHLPLYLVFSWNSLFGGDIWLFLWYYIPIGFIYTWLFNNTDSILIPAVLHASFNTVGRHAILSFKSNTEVTLTIIVIGFIMYVLVSILFAKYGRNLTKKPLPSLNSEEF